MYAMEEVNGGVSQNKAVAIALSVASLVVLGVASLSGNAQTNLSLAPASTAVATPMTSMISPMAQRMMYGVALRAAAADDVAEAAPAEEVEEAGSAGEPAERIRMKLKAYHVPLLESASEQIMNACQANEASTSGPVRLPTRRKIFCVLRSPHVNKNSMEHFEMRTHQRLIDVRNPTSEVIDSLMALDLPAGVDVEVKLT